MFKKLLKRINESVLDGKGHVSHTKISSFIILGSIIVSSVTFLLIDLTNAIIAWSKGGSYEIPIAHITIFGMVLGHHLFLLGIKKASENKQMEFDSKTNISKMENMGIIKSPDTPIVDLDEMDGSDLEDEPMV